MPAYYFTIDEVIVAKDDRSITLTFTDTSGNAVDISAWTFYYKAVKKDDSTVTIIVLNAAMTTSDSGTGTTDTVTIPRSDTVTNVAVGRYDHEITVVDGTTTTTIAKGTLTIQENITGP